MKYYRELQEHEKNKVLTSLQDLPLFECFKMDAHTLLLNSDVYMFDDKLTMYTKVEDIDNV